MTTLLFAQAVAFQAPATLGPPARERVPCVFWGALVTVLAKWFRFSAFIWPVYGVGDRDFGCDTVVDDPRAKRASIHFAPWIFRPFDHAFRFAEGMDQIIISSVSRLGAFIRQSAIVRRVWSVIVDSVQTQPWTSTLTQHPVNEFQRPLPLFAYCDTACSVVRVRWISHVLASTSHCLPHAAQAQNFSDLIFRQKSLRSSVLGFEGMTGGGPDFGEVITLAYPFTRIPQKGLGTHNLCQ